jgi:transcriptional regulator with XRE-family HTH domain
VETKNRGLSRIRALRQERGLSLGTLGDRTGLSKSYLSKVERGHSTPSIAAALKISDALGVDASRLFVEDGKQTAVAIDRHQDQPKAVQLRPLGSEMLGKLMSPFVLRPGMDFAPHESNHSGQELIFVHQGEIEVHYDDDYVVLCAGDSAYLDATLTHRLRSTSDAEAQVVVVTVADRS